MNKNYSSFRNEMVMCIPLKG